MKLEGSSWVEARARQERERDNSVMEVNMIKYITYMHKMP